MRYLSCLLLAFLSVGQTVGQDEKGARWELLNDKTGWSEGSILLSDNSQITGMVKYNDREGILSYHDGENKRVFGPRSVLGFEFFDDALQRQRVFYTLDYEVQGSKKPMIFEVLREFKTFAVLVKFDPVQSEYRTTTWSNPNTGYGTPAATGGGGTVLSQTETVYFMGRDGEVDPYFQNTVEQNGMRSIFTGKDDRVKSKVIDRDLLEKYTEPELYAKMVSYAKENDLEFRTQDDLLKILDYHEEQLKK